MSRLAITKKEKNIVKDVMDNWNDTDISIERMLLKFVKDKRYIKGDVWKMYEEFCSLLPDGADRPSPNSWNFYYCMVINGHLLDNQYKAYNNSIKKLSEEQAKLELDPDNTELKKEVEYWQRNIKSLEGRILEFSRHILKYSNDAINREQPKKIEHTHKSKISLSDIHQIMTDSTIRVN